MSTRDRFYSQISPHIRGRVFSMGPSSVPGLTRWGMEITNARTGRVVASDNCTRFAVILELADEMTAIARAACWWDMRRRELRP